MTVKCIMVLCTFMQFEMLTLKRHPRSLLFFFSNPCKVPPPCNLGMTQNVYIRAHTCFAQVFKDFALTPWHVLPVFAFFFAHNSSPLLSI